VDIGEASGPSGASSAADGSGSSPRPNEAEGARRLADLSLDRALRAAQLNKLLLDSLPHPAVLLSRDRVVLAANRIARQRGAVVGRPCWLEFGQPQRAALPHPADEPENPGASTGSAPCPFCRADEAFAQGEAICTRAVEAFGATWDLHWIPLDDETYLHYAVDVTSHNRTEELLRQERDKAQRYLDIAGAILVVIQADQRIGLLNRRGCEILGANEEDAIGRNWFDCFVPERVREDVRGAFTQLMAGRVEPVEYYENPVVASDSSERLIAWHNTVLRDETGRIIATLSSGEDITEQRLAEIQLKETVAELERSNADLEQFAHVVSHDLQGPLVAISGFAQLLARRYRDRLDAQADRLIGQIVSGVERMQSLIHDVLEYSRAGGGDTAFEPVACSGVVDKVLLDLGAAIGESGATVTSDPLPSVVGDASQLTQLFQNLIGNALKFRREEPPVVHIGAVRDGECWHFSVSDNGIGMPAKALPRIFLMFQRLHGSAEYPGSGVGLAICKRIVERHGGRIWATSRPGEGSTFHFTLAAAVQ